MFKLSMLPSKQFSMNKNSPSVAKTKKPLRVCIFQPAFPEYRLPVFSKLSKIRGIKVSIYYGKVQNLTNIAPEGLLAYATKPLNIRIFEENFVLNLRWFSEVLKRNYDVYVFTWDLHHLFIFPALIAARLLGLGTVLWGHGYSKSERTWRKSLRDWVGHLADIVVLYNYSTAAKLKKEGWIASRLKVAPNTIDQSKIQQARNYWLSKTKKLSAFQKNNRVSPEKTVLFCSRLEQTNRIDVLIAAHARLLKLKPETNLIIIGHGPDEFRLKRIVERLEVQNSVRFTGPIYDQYQLAPWFLSAGVFCYPTNSGLSLLHAFGYGLPVVTADDLSAQNPEIETLKNGKNGFLYRTNDIHDLSEKLQILLENKSLRKRLGNEARFTALKKYPIEKMVKSLNDSFLKAAAMHSNIGKDR